MKVPCPFCAQALQYYPELAGTTAACSRCNKTVQMPSLRQLPGEYQHEYQEEQDRLRKKQEAQHEKLAQRVLPDAKQATLEAKQAALAAKLETQELQREKHASNWPPLCISIAAMLLSTIVMSWTLLHEPFGKGIRHYDFSSSGEALMSVCKIKAGQSPRALMELGALMNDAESAEKLETLKIEKSVEFLDKVIMFVSFKKDGKVMYECEVFAKHARTGYWLPQFTTPDMVRKFDAGLARRMEDWEKLATAKADESG
jgi:hypothetical protein